MRLAGKVALVAGAGQMPGETRGNGRAIAERFAAEGAQVLCMDRLLDRAEATATAIGEAAVAMSGDVTQAEDCAAAVALAVERFGRIDILVNNVGIGGGDGPAHALEEAAFDRIMAVNLKGGWLMTRAALAPMRAQRGGAIVNISSLASLAGGFQMAYEVSKAAMNRMTLSVANANAGRGIRCNAILPGFLDTPMAVAGIAGATGRSTDAVRAERNARVPLGGRMGDASDTANAALFLASDEARFITGVLLPVDGGMATRVG
ncbi:glucose 1-dehydrogenase [Sphingomonas sp. R647]|uniref:SDR family NAD(P)-dependent oxidoreductase n=1 Tax=Sphingomonas sp. R647 TaxID=2875233 RepID=UPI001CD7F928|nr:glucose 1-dehydrogenase [Sphingomonas sp. R647]MCA1200085.1 glucose 1-dehydrogenase [Sphingomonas sp. R647]